MERSMDWRRCAQQVQRYFRRRMKDREDRLECVQDACYRLWVLVSRKGMRLSIGFVERICSHVLCDFLRMRYKRRSRKIMTLDQAGEDALADPRCTSPWAFGFEGVSRPRMLSELDRAIAQLPSGYRIAMQARSRGLRMREIATQNGWSVHKVRMCLHRGRHMLDSSIRRNIRDAERERIGV
jgi:DNA-directed RNA polymerase specialized sigma24 family protein